MSKRKSSITVVIGVLLVGAAVALFMPIHGEAFPDLELNAPMTRQGSEYLGLTPDQDTFRLSDIDASYVLIEAVNTMCGHCRKSAHNVDALFTGLSQQAAPARLKTLALFLHDDETAVRNAKRYFPGTHPRIADPMGRLAQAGETVVPVLYAIRLDKDGDPHDVVYKHRGRLDDPDAVKWSILLRLGDNRFDSLWSLAAGLLG